MFSLKLFKLFNRRLVRTISIIVVIIIVGFLLLAPNIVTKLLSVRFYSRLLESVDTHYQLFGYVDRGRLYELRNILDNLSVTGRHVYLILGIDVRLFYGNSSSVYMAYTAYPDYKDALKFIVNSFRGNVLNSPDEIMVSTESNFSSLELDESLGLGDPESNLPFTNVSLVGVYESKGIRFINFSQFGYGSGEISGGAEVFIHPELFSKLLSKFKPGRIRYRLIVVYEPSFFESLDLQEVISKLGDSNNSIKSYVNRIADIDDESNNLLAELMIYSFARNFVNLGIYINAIPFFVGVWYLLSINIDLLISDYRREIAILRARGIHSSTLYYSFSSYIIVITILALVIGFLSIPIWLPLIFTNFGLSFGINYLRFIDWSTAFLVTATVLFIIGITLWRRKRVFSDIAPSEAMHLHEVSSETYIERPVTRSTIILFILGFIKILEWLLNINLVDLLPRDGNIFIFIVGGLYSLLSGFLNIFAPLFFIYSSIKLITYSDKVIRILSKISSIFVGKGFRSILVSYVSRSPRWLSKGAFISSLMIALMIFSVVYSVRSVNFYLEYNKINSGSILVFPINVDNSDLNQVSENINSSLSKFEGVDTWCLSAIINVGNVYFKGRELISGYRFRYILVVKNTEDISNVIFLGVDWNYFGESSLIDSVRRGLVVRYKLYKEIVNQMGFHMGERLKLFLGPSIPINVNPRLKNNLSESISIPVTGALYVMPEQFDAITTMEALNNLGYKLDSIKWKNYVLIVRVSDGYNFSEVKNSLIKLLNSYPLGEVKNTLVSPSVFSGEFQLVSSYSYYLYAILGILAAVSSILLLTFQYIRRSFKDMVILRARGVKNKDVLRFMYAVSIHILIFSMILGIFTGFVSGYGVSQMNIASLVGGNPHYTLIIDSGGISAILGVVLVYLFTPIPVILKYRKMDLNEVIKRVE